MAKLVVFVFAVVLPLSAGFSMLLQPMTFSNRASHHFPVALKVPKTLQRSSIFHFPLRQSVQRCQIASGAKDSETIVFDEIDLQNMKVSELKDLCKSFNLATGGKKGELIARLLEAASTSQANDDSNEAVSPDGSPISDNSEPPAAVSPPSTNAQNFDSTASSFAQNPNTEGSWTDSNDMLVEGRFRLFTQPRTGNCWHGLFFDIESLGKGITITGIRTASAPEYQGALREDRMNINLYTREGSAVGKEKVPEGWRLIGNVKGVQLPTVVYGETEAFFGPLPLREPVRIPPGGTAGFCVFTTSWRGIVLRAKLESKFQPGEATDEDSNVRLRAGLLPKNDKFFEDTMFSEVPAVER